MPRIFRLSASMLRAYKSCPRKFELAYIEKLKPVTPAEYLTTGMSYHKCIESILAGVPYEAEDVVAEMAHAFDRFVPWRSWRVSAVEQEFAVPLNRYSWMVGKIDAILEDGTPLEHKTYASTINEKYIDHLALDDQVSFYLLAQTKLQKRPVTRVQYTVCQKPTIKHTQKETREEYLARVREWYDESKVQVVTAVRSPRELAEIEEQVLAMIREIRSRKHWYRNPSNCNIISCEFRAICQNYDPQISTNFVKKERESEELAARD